MEEIKGSCYCGHISYTITKPEENLLSSCFCHCSRCQRLNATPCLWTTHWPAEAVKWDKEPDRYEVMKDRKWRLRCSECGAQVGSWNALKNKWSLWPVHFNNLRNKETNVFEVKDVPWLKPTAHIFWDTHIIEVADDLPKYKEYAGQSERLA